ncbi:MAG TPA: hypothetical protein VK983_02705 [Candidatus Limnocylindrales bacterium]|nr:hypothetical protein [Candidatus Limnocylindrales bacterium]
MNLTTPNTVSYHLTFALAVNGKPEEKCIGFYDPDPSIPVVGRIVGRAIESAL